VVVTAGQLAEIEGLRGYDAVHLAAAIAAKVTVVATATTNSSLLLDVADSTSPTHSNLPTPPMDQHESVDTAGAASRRCLFLLGS
jgi:hypothetical protein